MCFVPRREGAAEGDGYLVGVATRLKENGRSDLIIIDAQYLENGVIASGKMPYRVPGQVHGFRVNGYQLPADRACCRRRTGRTSLAWHPAYRWQASSCNKRAVNQWRSSRTSHCPRWPANRPGRSRVSHGLS